MIDIDEGSKNGELKLTLEGLNEAAKSNPIRGLSTIHLSPRWMDRDWEDEQEKVEDESTPLDLMPKTGNSNKDVCC